MMLRALFRAKNPNFSASFFGILTKHLPQVSTTFRCGRLYGEPVLKVPIMDLEQRRRLYHDGRPRGPLWRGKKLLGKEALFVIQGMKRFKDNDDNLAKFIKFHVLRLLKLEKITVLNELERQEEVGLALKMFRLIEKEDWFKPDVFLYKDLIISLAKGQKMEEAMQVWASMKEKELFPDSQTYAEVIRGFLRYGSPADAMNIYEDMKRSPDPPEELAFRILLKGLVPHPLLRNRVKQDFAEFFPERHIYDPLDETFGMQ
ncbi:pentatricopeptide repeat-containing protein At3g46870 [Phalaenopsis equestris]|uniref:pentatricopeptide repeat-containing protein At3g46870 n=1 Tax=Phalaenopsis equestris TaxID=78828 RepID=UPI0009E5D926|nr:pentatricopeptide repeat-containing protein At3g46870 [Phalaenopsis equestris]XP_020593174.1 pentatricopeptide repeat-containing protein At3g46870 [Phalaenopsis equestris]XP_020593176.1 pentatricopeptide repeat-containing protein At3g46870 [Phalaenopsis equestris]